MTRAFQSLTLLMCCAVVTSDAVGQRTYSSSGRNNAGMGGRTSFGQRWGTPAARGYRSPGNNSSSPDWTLHKPYSRIPSYSPRSTIRSYSTPPLHSRAYGHYHGPVNYGGYYNYGYPYSFGLQFPVVTGYGVTAIGVVAPPIVAPYGGFFPSYGASVAPGLSVAVPAYSPPAPIVAQPPAPAPAVVEKGKPVSQRLPPDETPIVNEFGNRFQVITDKPVAAADRIRSLRYQTSGDNAFRKKDYASAEVFYRTAADTAPIRRAPFLRLAWTQLAQSEYEEAVSSLKTALNMQDDPTSSWISGADLYGAAFQQESGIHNDQLWHWLQSRPNSTDRLLLAAAFQQVRGYAGISRELLDTASRAGLDVAVVNSLTEIAQDIADRKPAQKRAAAVQPEPAVEAEDGIRLRGREVLPSGNAQSPVGPAEPLSPNDKVPSGEQSATPAPPKTNDADLQSDPASSLLIPVPSGAK